MFGWMQVFTEGVEWSFVRHLGQVRLGVLEVDGTLSLLFYDKGEEQFGLPLFPEQFKE